MTGGNVEMMVSVVPGTMTGFASLNAGLASINNAFLNMTQAISDNFGLVDTAIITTGVVAAQMASDAMSAFGDFEQGMKIVQMVSGQTADDMSYLGQKANEFSVQYRVGIDQITEGLQTLGRAGLNSATEQTEVLENGLSTAKLEARDLNGVLEELIQNTALLGGDLKSNEFGEDSKYVNDLLVATSMTAPITTHDVSETLKYSGGIAAAAGANIESDEGKKILEDYMATIAAFAQKGVTGSIAGTALRAFLNKPATQDNSVVEGLAAIQLKPEYLWEDDQETMKPISEQIALIQAQMDKLDISKMDRLQIWSKIVGGKMGQQMIKLDSDDIQDLTRDIQKAESAESLANESMKTFNANVNQIGQKGAAAFREFGSNLVFIFNPVLELVNKFMDIFNNPVAITGFVGVFLGAMRVVASKMRQVIAGIRQAISNIWRDIQAGQRLSIRAYRGDTRSGGGGGFVGQGLIAPKDATTPKSFLDAWKEQAMLKSWKDYQSGRLSEGQYGAIAATQKWKGHNNFLQDEYKVSVRDNDLIKKMAYGGHLTKDQIKDLQSGMNKSQFMDKHGEDLGTKYYQEYIVKTKEAAQATQKHGEAVKNSATTQQESSTVVTETGEQIVTNTRNTAKTVLTEWNQMCSSLVSSIQNKSTNKTKKPNIFDQVVKDQENGVNGIKRYTKQPELDSQRVGHSIKQSLSNITPGTAQSMIGMYKVDEAIKERENLAIRSLLSRYKNSYGIPDYSDKRATSAITPGMAQTYSRPYYEQQQKNAQEKAAIQEKLAIEKKIQTLDIERRAIEQQILAIEERKAGAASSGLYKGTKPERYDKSNVNAGRELQARIDANRKSSGYKNTGVSTREIEAALNRYGSQYGFSDKKQEISNLRQAETQKNLNNEILKENKDLLNRTIQQKPMGVGIANPMLGFRDRLGMKSSAIGESVKNFGSTFFGKLKNTILDPRNNKTLGFANKGFGKVGNAALNVADMFGGPLMIAMMAFSYIIEYVSNLYQEYCQSLKDAKNAVDEAYKKRDEADKDLTKSYEASGLTGDDLEDAMGNVYNQLNDDLANGTEAWVDKAGQGHTNEIKEYEYNEEADDGSTKEKEQEELSNESAIQENTAALYAATGELRIALDKFVSKANDGTWGIDGLSSQLSDTFGKIQDTQLGYSEGSQFSTEGSFLKTASQKDENYAGYTELAGLMLEDLHDAEGNWRKGFKTLLGSKDGKTVANRMSPEGQAAMQQYGNFAKGLSRADNTRLQASMMKNKKDWQGLAKEIAKYENKNKKKVGKEKTDNKRLERLVSKLATETGLSRVRALQAASLQQFQDMYEVAQGAIVPTIDETAMTASQMYSLHNSSFDSSLGQTASETAGTDANAAAIAALLSVMAQQKAREAAYQEAYAKGETNAKSVEEYMREAHGTEIGFDLGGIKNVVSGVAGAFGYDRDKVDKMFDITTTAAGIKDNHITLGRFGENQKAIDRIAMTEEQMKIKAEHPDWSKDQVYQGAKDALAQYKQGDKYTSGIDALENTIMKGYSDAIADRVKDAYLASNMGEEDNDSGGSGGGDGGGDSGSDDNKGTKKERVDLVLCNKKEIPKLNVNLFKKAPSFTVLNKNFKLRDIKVNTQDKPKAVLSSIKNAIIDVQKRSDPKIIQDETAEYDPAAATDGTNVPSGSTNTGTD